MPLRSGDTYERVLEQCARGTGDALQILMQQSVGRAAVRAFGTVALEGAEAAQKFDEVVRTFAVKGSQRPRKPGQ